MNPSRFDALSRLFSIHLSRRRLIRACVGAVTGGVGEWLRPARPAGAYGCSSSSDCMSGQDCCGGLCAWVKHDNSNCGACYHVCSYSAGETCQNHTCKCSNGGKKCGGECVNVRTNRNHCGACFHSCPSGQVCSGGSCDGDGAGGDDEQRGGAGAATAALGPHRVARTARTTRVRRMGTNSRGIPRSGASTPNRRRTGSTKSASRGP